MSKGAIAAITQLVLGGVGCYLLAQVDWRIALGVFLCIFGENIAWANRMKEHEHN
jgi:hypothetical protein